MFEVNIGSYFSNIQLDFTMKSKMHSPGWKQTMVLSKQRKIMTAVYGSPVEFENFHPEREFGRRI